MSTPDHQTTTERRRRDYVLSEFRCALTQAKLAQLEIEAVGMALKHNIVTPEQAAAMFWDSPSVQFLGLDLGQARGAAQAEEVSA